MTAILQQLQKKTKELKQVPAVAHVLRMNTRYGTRLGNQFAGAITYFSLLAMVPILMFAFSAFGFTLTVLRPDLLERVQAAIMVQLQGAPEDLQAQLTGLIEGLLRNWASVGLVGLFSSMYSSAGWAGNLKSAVRAQTRPLFDMKEHKHFILMEVLLNFGILLGLLIILAVTFALAVIATSLTGTIVHWLALDRVPGVSVLLRIVGPILSATAGWAMFVYLYKVLPEQEFPFRIIAWGALIGSAGLFGLQYLTGFLMGKFSGNPAAAVFGPVITLMLFFNLFARLVLYVAAWIATSVQPAVPDQIQEFDRPLLKAPNVSDQVRREVRAGLKKA
ncbi:MAG: tRNA-processing ribonuclease [Deltaproteobacteria bacterium HGW-Deltaproteobacteria-21]|nr:MAG: tRNA-processing ribonuclease [Deltaproteobacteria bacterium HGW-Deltaproteobacteria-21]